MDRSIQQKKVYSGAGVDLSKPRSMDKPKRSSKMQTALERTKKESQDFLSGVVSFRLEKEQLDQLMNKANAMGLSAGQLARSWVVGKLNQLGESSFSESQQNELKHLIREFVSEAMAARNANVAKQH